MSGSCTGICIRYDVRQSHRNSFILGYKRCTYCNLYMKHIEPRCPCCKNLLRQRGRNNKAPTQKQVKRHD